MAFLIPSDYATQIKNDLLQVLIRDAPTALASAELSAQSEMESYLRGRYDLPQVFPPVLPWAAGRSHAAGTVVYHGEPAVVYVAGTQGSPPDQEPGAAVVAAEPGAPAPVAAWEAKDPRHPLIITYLVDATLYLLHSRQNPRGIPELRADRYEHVLAWLNLCRQGKISPGLPLLPLTRPDGTPTPESLRIRTGSLLKLRNSY